MRRILPRNSPRNSPTAFPPLIRYAHEWFGADLDAVVFEKTDKNQADPDGGIAFTNVGNDGVSDTAMVIRGNGRVGMGTKTPEEKLHVSGNIKQTNGGFTTSGELTIGELANEVGKTMKAAIAHSICHANTKAGDADGNHGVIVLPFVDRTKSVDDECKDNINNSWRGCGVVKEGYFNQVCPGDFLFTTGKAGYYDYGGYTSYASAASYPNGPQEESCEGDGANVKAWICCSPQCA